MQINRILKFTKLTTPILLGLFITQCNSLPRMGINRKAKATEGTHIILAPELSPTKIGLQSKEIMNNSKNPYHFLTASGDSSIEVRAIFTKNSIYHISYPIEVKTKSKKGDIILFCSIIKKPNYHYQTGDTMVVEIAVKQVKLKPTKENLIFYENEISPELFASKCPKK